MLWLAKSINTNRLIKPRGEDYLETDKPSCVLTTLLGTYFYMSRRRRLHFVMLLKIVLQSKEWKELSPAAKIIYIKIKANYSGDNNGNISFKYTEAIDEFSAPTISKALKELINKGWIEKTQCGGLYRYYCLYKLTGKYDQIITKRR